MPGETLAISSQDAASTTCRSNGVQISLKCSEASEQWSPGVLIQTVLSASARAGSPHQEFNKYLGAPKTQPDVELRRGSGSIEIKQILSATSRETLFSGTACPGLVIAPVYYCRRLLSPTSDTHIGLLSPPFSASATSWRLLGHQQARLQIRVRCRPVKTPLRSQPHMRRPLVHHSWSTSATANDED